MKKIALTMTLCISPAFANTHVYKCEVAVAEVKNEEIVSMAKIAYGALVVDSGKQFYIMRDEQLLTSPPLSNRNGKLSGVGKDKNVYMKAGGVYAVHQAEVSFFFDECRELS